MTRYVVGLDAGTSKLREADHLLVALAAELALPKNAFGCTHLVRGDRPRVALSFTLPAQATSRAALGSRPRDTRHGAVRRTRWAARCCTPGSRPSPGP